MLKTVNPVINSNQHYNPYMGIVPRANDITHNTGSNHKLVFAYYTWKDLETTKYNYNWTQFEIDNNFTYWKSKGCKIIVRIVCDLPDTNPHRDIPDYVYNETGDGWDYNIQTTRYGYTPNYENYDFINYFSIFIRAFMLRYANDNFFALIEFGALGHWGENHIDLTIPNAKFPTENFVNQYLDMYLTYCTAKKVSYRRPYNKYKLSQYNDGLGSDSQAYDWGLDWINEGYKSTQTDEMFTGNTNYYKQNMVGGESFGALSTYLNNANIAKMLQHIADYKLSYFKCTTSNFFYDGAEAQANSQDVIEILGYRFNITSVVYNDESLTNKTIAVTVNLANVGISLLNYNFSFGVVIAKNNITQVAGTAISNLYQQNLANGTASLFLPDTLNSGIYDVELVMFDEEGNSCYLGNDGRTARGYYKIGEMVILNSRALLY